MRVSARLVMSAVVLAGIVMSGCAAQEPGGAPVTTARVTDPPLADLDGCLSRDEATIFWYRGSNVRAAVGILGDGATGVVISFEQDGSACRWLPLATALQKAGYRVLLYHRYEGNTDDFVEAMVALIRERGVEQVALVGGSIGGISSIVSAARIIPSVAAVVSLSGADDQTVAAASQLRQPLLQIVASGDGPFPGSARSTDLAATKSIDHQLILIDGTAHASLLFVVDGSVIGRVQKFLTTHLPPGGSQTS